MEDMDVADPATLRAELLRAQEERDAYEEQYQMLLAKISQMRTTLGERLQQDAVR